jgi:drug/metabolite transporter (DMT)-like permease
MRERVQATARGDTLTPFHNMFAMNLWQGTMKLGMMVYADSLTPAIAFIERHPDVLTPLLAQVGTYVFGAMCLYTLIIMFDSLTATTVTTLRKLVSILSSVVLYGHPLAPLQGVGVFVVVFSKKIAAFIAGGGKKDEKKKTQ